MACPFGITGETGEGAGDEKGAGGFVDTCVLVAWVHAARSHDDVWGAGHVVAV